MLGLLGLPVSEACNVRIQDTQGWNEATGPSPWSARAGNRPQPPLALPVAEVMDAAVGEQDWGPLLLRADGK